MAPSWSVTPAKVRDAVRRIISTGRPKRLYLFGSYVRRASRRPRDLDMLVVVRDGVKNTRKESVRLRRAMNGISMPVDLLVVREGQFGLLVDQPGLVYREAVRTGKLVYESSR